MAPRKPKAEPDSVSRFIIDGKPYEIDVEHLTWGEIEEIEVYFDGNFDDLELATARGTMILAYLAMKRSDKSVTLDFIRDLELSQISADESERPTEPRPATSGAQG